MVEGIDESQFSLYPPRVSEQIETFDASSEVIPLTVKEKEQLISFEEPFYKEVIKLREIKDNSAHTIYPGYFLTEEGRKLFDQTYLSSKPELRISDSDNPLKEGDIVAIISDLDLSQIKEDLRKKAAFESSNWAEEEFKKNFLAANSDVNKIENPKRISFLENPGNFKQIVENLRKVKSEIKLKESELQDKDDNLSEAKLTVLGMYRRLVNVMIAKRYGDVRVLVNKDVLTENEKEILGLFRLPVVHFPDESPQRLYQAKIPRFMERIDHYLQGVGLSLTEKGLFVSVPEKLKTYIEQSSKKGESKSDLLKATNSYLLNAQQIKDLADLMIAVSGYSQGEGAWKTEIAEVKGGLKCFYREKGEIVRTIKIPKNETRKLGDILVTLEHEFEGHALRAINRDRLENSLKIVEDLVGGRGGVLNEGVAKWVENHVKKRMFGIEGTPAPYYLAVIMRKAAGGTFKECFKDYLEMYSKREYDLNLNGLLSDSEKFDQAASHVFPLTLRIFRRYTPLDDDSGYLADTRQLKYVEGTLVTKALEESGLLFKYGFIAGLDLNSIPDLEKIGMLNTGNIIKPKFVISDVIFPKLATHLFNDKAVSFDEALERTKKDLGI